MFYVFEDRDWGSKIRPHVVFFLPPKPLCGCCCSVAQSCPPLCSLMDWSTRGSPPLSPRVCSDSCLLSRWCHPTISASATTFSFCLRSFPASGSFPLSLPFASGGQSIGASASVLPMNIQGWFPLGLTDLISLQSKGLSQESSSVPQFESISFLVLSLLYGLPLTSIHDYSKNHSFDFTDLCWQNDVSAF